MGDIMKKDVDKLEKQIEALSNIVKKDDREVTEMKKKELVEKVRRATTNDDVEEKVEEPKKTTKKRKTKKSDSTKKSKVKSTKRKTKTKKLDKEVKEIVEELEATKQLSTISEADTSFITKTVNDLESEIRNLYDDNTLVMKPVDEVNTKKKKNKKKNNVEVKDKFTKINPVTSGSAVVDKMEAVDEKALYIFTKILLVLFILMFIGVCAMIFYITIA